MTKKRIYWLCQLLGWSAWITNEAIFYSNEFGHENFWFESTILNLVLCIFLTHQLRALIKKFHWVELPINQAVIRIISAVIIMAAIISFVNIPLDFDALEDVIDKDITAIMIIQYVLYWGKPIMFWALFYYSYHYFERKTEMEVEKIKLESSIRETESKVLRAQMNPHFMFNALNSIRALVLEDPSKAQKGITQLSNILRSSLLADRRKTVSLLEELRTVDDYLALEKIRYEERLMVEKNISTESLHVQIPPMLLQTLIENAIKHGVSKPIKGGFVKLETSVSENKLYINISNTGQLISTESGGFGLENTAQRLNLLFGEEAKFEISQTSKDIVTANIIIPFSFEKEGTFPFGKMANNLLKKAAGGNIDKKIKIE
jgi:two-component system, LytTR family, sensor kinase